MMRLDPVMNAGCFTLYRRVRGAETNVPLYCIYDERPMILGLSAYPNGHVGDYRTIRAAKVALRAEGGGGMSGAVKEFSVGTHIVKIYPDEDVESPRKDRDNLGHMVCFHRRYTLGDGHDFRFEDFDGWSGLEAELEKRGAAVVLPLYLYDHSGITMRTGPFSCPWDSGRVGAIYATKDELRKEYSRTRITAAMLRKATAVLEGEVEEYDRFLTGDVYGYVVEDKEGGHVDSCWGFYGLEYCEAEARAAVPKEAAA